MHIRSTVVRCGVWVVLGLVAGCETDGELPTSGLVVTVLRDSPAVPANGAVVTVGTPPMAIATGVTGVAFFLVPPGTYSITAALITYCPATTSATVTTGGATHVTMSLGAAPCVTSGSDRITTAGSEPFYGLVDIQTGSATCENDRLIEGVAGTADLLTNARLLSACHGAAWIFTADHAPWFDNTTATFPWTDATGDVLTTTLPADRMRIPVTFWLSDATLDEAAVQATLLGGDVPKANAFFREHRAGFRLTNSETADTDPDVIDVGTLTDSNTGQPPYPQIGIGCRNTPTITASTLVYRPAHINIYVVEAIDGDNIAAGRNCIDHGAGNVIFLDDDAGFVTLLHEIGHGLALSRPHWGHTDLIKGMFPDNVMASGATIAGHVSLGQLVRMHAESGSWLNATTGAGSVRSRQSPSAFTTACNCPGNSATADCPQVDADVARPDTPNAGGTNPAACHVKAIPTCLALATGASGTITAKGFTDASETTLGVGDGTVFSLAPAVATAIKPAIGGEGPGFVMAEVKAGPVAGLTADILMSLGGTFVRVPVKVGGACP